MLLLQLLEKEAVSLLLSDDGRPRSIAKETKNVDMLLLLAAAAAAAAAADVAFQECQGRRHCSRKPRSSLLLQLQHRLQLVHILLMH